MTLKHAFGASVVAALLLSAAMAHAGGPAAVAIAPSPAVAPAPAAKPTMTFAFEITPEFYASTKGGSYSTGDLADTVAKLSLSKALPNGFNLSGALSMVAREPDTAGSATTYDSVELSTSYKFKLGSAWSVTPSATLGYAFGELPKVNPANAAAAEAYYAVAVAADYKLAPGLTWNVVNVRYRDSFIGNWATPKISTGVTFGLDDTNSIYANIGKSWKDSGAGYKNDKFAIAFGLKHAF